MDIIKTIRKLNPFLWAEESDAKRWYNIKKEDLIIAYKEFIESEKRLQRIKEKITELQ